MYLSSTTIPNGPVCAVATMASPGIASASSCASPGGGGGGGDDGPRSSPLESGPASAGAADLSSSPTSSAHDAVSTNVVASAIRSAAREPLTLGAYHTARALAVRDGAVRTSTIPEATSTPPAMIPIV